MNSPDKPASLARAASIDDLRALARKRLPRFAFDFIDGGAEDEINLSKNSSAFSAIELTPRYLVDVSAPVTETELFGQTYAVPFGMAPIGFFNMAWPGADLMIARLAAERNMPHVISTASSTPLEEIAAAAGGNAWFQLYMPNDDAMLSDLLRRAEAAGCTVLLVTIDVAQPGKRDRDVRNGLQVPFRPTPRVIADLIRHPRWALGTWRGGAPQFANFTLDRSGGEPPSLVEIQQRMVSASFDWDDFKRLRDRWKGKLLIKGILHHRDALMAADAGCDGIVVSNHGGRQADYAPASIAVLPVIAAALAGRIPILLDGGIRRGADIVRARALGASFVLAGRAFAYGAAAGGEAGCRHAFDLLQTELKRTLGQIGRPDFNAVDATVLSAGAPSDDHAIQ